MKRKEMKNIMLYIVCDQVKNGDLFTEEFDDLEKAVKAANRDWEHMSDYDKNRREAFYVLESANPDESAENHFDGDPVIVLK